MFGIDKLKEEIIINNSKIDEANRSSFEVLAHFNSLSNELRNLNASLGMKDRNDRFTKLIRLEECENHPLLLSGEYSIQKIINQDIIEIRDVVLASNKTVSKDFTISKAFAVLVKDPSELIKEWKHKIDIGEANFPVFKEMESELDTTRETLDGYVQEVLDHKAIVADRDALLEFIKHEIKESYYFSLKRKYEDTKQQGDKRANDA